MPEIVRIYHHKGLDISADLKRLKSSDFLHNILESSGKKGVEALRNKTPIRTGKTAASWEYKIERGASYVSIVWSNSNVTKDGDPIALLIQYGHGTGTGGYVSGVDYINPAMEPIFAEIEEEIRKAVARV